VRTGTTITWTWTGQNQHSVTFDSTAITSSPVQGNGGTHAVTFNDAGTFTYFCTVHGKSVMSGTVIVQ